MKRGPKELCGYGGNILRVDLSKGKITNSPSPLGELKKFLGGAGYASKILYDEVPPEIGPFDPENRVILSTGLLCGTLAPCSGRFTVTTLSPLTGIFCDANCGGFFGAELKLAGYDHVIIQGKASSPVYLWIDDDQVEIRDATQLWGKDTWETDTRIKEELGNGSIQIACIGPAGENLSCTACLIANKARAAARGGMGAVLGSKKLKAIAVRGRKGVKIAYPDQHAKLCEQLFDKVLNDPGYMLLSTYGTGFLNDSFQEQHVTAYKYGFVEEFYWEGYDKLSQSEYQKNFWDHPMACFNCPIHC
ncbi:MAG: aldehyde ferredoxin oxidoreductase, partial [Nitrospira sp.]|nr:aldehyde ferredoxin oxidoreductase [Nitrospira sp.]